jgi:DNA-binding NtrC family response regulator
MYNRGEEESLNLENVKPTRLKLLIVDDDSTIAGLVGQYAKELDYLEPITFSWPDDALKWAANNEFDIALIDYQMPVINGLELIRRLKDVNSGSYYLLMTGYGEFEIAVEALRVGVFDFITKPIAAKDFEIAIERAKNHWELANQNKVLLNLLKGNYGKGKLIGNSNEINVVQEKINMFAESDAPILITGETGVGKEVVAQMIHTISNRRSSRFVAINCSAYAETLLESELFGHEKGAFTGADRRRIGRFEFAKKGTILLDEICEMPQQIQVKLLRVLQEKEFERVGGNEQIKLDGRIISATNRNVLEEIDMGKFREDLYFRLNTIHIHIPALRKRVDDIKPLAEHFLNKFALIHNKEISHFSDSVIDIFMNYRWPGNVRQLENVTDYAVISCDNGFIQEKNLPEEIVDGKNAKTIENVKSEQENIIFNTKPVAGSNPGRSVLITYLEKNRWNKTKTAVDMGITRSQLLYRLKKSGIS